MNPPERALVFCVDKHTQIQASITPSRTGSRRHGEQGP